MLRLKLNVRHSNVIDRVVSARHKSTEELTSAIKEFFEAMYVSAEEWREAIALLRAIKPDSGFVYYPNVLCSLKLVDQALVDPSVPFIASACRFR